MNKNKLIRWLIHMWKIARNGTSCIPKGYYCYSLKQIPSNEENRTHFIPCPYWEENKDIKREKDYDYGFCWYLNKGDWEENRYSGLLWDHRYNSLLWDRCKECFINMELEE